MPSPRASASDPAGFHGGGSRSSEPSTTHPQGWPSHVSGTGLENTHREYGIVTHAASLCDSRLCERCASRRVEGNHAPTVTRTVTRNALWVESTRPATSSVIERGGSGVPFVARTGSQPVRTAATLASRFPMPRTASPFPYIRVAGRAARLKSLGLTDSAIAPSHRSQRQDGRQGTAPTSRTKRRVAPVPEHCCAAVRQLGSFRNGPSCADRLCRLGLPALAQQSVDSLHRLPNRVVEALMHLQ